MKENTKFVLLYVFDCLLYLFFSNTQIFFAQLALLYQFYTSPYVLGRKKFQNGFTSVGNVRL